MTDAAALGRCLFESTADPLLIIRCDDLHVVDANRGAAEYLGISPTELAGRHISELIDFGEPVDSVDDLSRSECRFRSQSGGGPHPALSSTALPLNASEAVVSLRHRNGSSLQPPTPEGPSRAADSAAPVGAAQQRLHQLIQNAPICIHEIELDGTLSSMNRAGLSMLGDACERDIIGVPYLSFISEPDRERVADLLNRAMAGETVTRFEFSTDSGEVLRSCFIPLQADDGTVERLMGLTQNITAERRAHQNLQESESIFRSLFEQAAVGVAEVDAETYRIQRANGCFEQILRTEATGRTLGELLQTDQQDPIAAPDDGGGCCDQSFELPVQRSDGSTVWVNVCASDGRDGRRTVVLEDVTDRRQAEAALRSSESNLVALIENTRDNILSVDQDYRILTANSQVREAAMNAFGCDLKPGLRILDHLPDDIAEVWRDRYDRALHGDRFTIEERHEHQGEVAYFEVSFNPIVSGDEIRGVAVFSRNVTHRRLTEQQRLKNERLLETTNHVADVGGWELDLKQQSLVWTEQTCRLFDVAPDFDPDIESMIGFFAPEFRAQVRRAFADGTENGQPWDLEAECRTATGRAIWVRFRGEVEQLGSEVIRLYGAVQDISDRKRAESQLRTRLAFETLVSRISSAFINITAGEIDQEIETHLGALGGFLNLDRVSIGTLSPDKTRLWATYEWVAPGVASVRELFQGLNLSGMTWGRDRLARGVVTAFSRVDDLPGGAAPVKEILERIGTQSAIMVPLVVGGEVCGLVNFESLTDEREWPDDLTNQLRLVGEIFANAISRKQNEAALRASEARFRLAFNQQFQFMAILSPEGRVLELNNLPLLVEEADRDEYLGKLFWEAPAWDGLPEWQDMIRWRIHEALSKDEPVLAEDMYRTVNGAIRFADAAYSVVRDPDGDPQFILVQASDITERRRAERALRHRLEFEALLSRISSDFINVASQEIDQQIESCLGLVGEFMGVDRALLTEFSDDKSTLMLKQEWAAEGIEPSGAQYQIFESETFPWAAQRWERAEVIVVQRVADLPAEARSEREVLTNLGVKSYVAVPLVVSGQVVGEVCFDSVRRERTWSTEAINQIRLVGEIFANAISRKRAEDALRASEQRWQFAVEGSRDGVWDRDLITGDIYVTPRLKDMLGDDSTDDFSSVDGWADRLHPDDRERCLEQLNQHLEGKTPFYQNEHQVRCADGSYKWVLDRGLVISRSADGKPLRMIGTYSDISARKQSEALLEGEKRILELIASGAAAESVLCEVIRLIESQSEMICSVLRLDQDTQQLRHCAAPSLPTDYTRAVDGLRIGPKVGSCGTAAFLNCEVIVSDIAEDPLWNEFREVAIPHGLRACWSVPLRSSVGQVLGTLAMYFRHPTTPTENDELLIDRAAHLASIVLEKQRSELQLRAREEQLRSMLSQLAAAEERERRRVSRILHDQLSPTIAVCQMRISALESGFDEVDRNRAILNEVWERLEECSNQARSLAVETSPPVLYELGLIPALEWLAERFQEHHSIQCRFSTTVRALAVDESTLAPVFQAARELLTNIARHAQASTVDITLRVDEETMVLTVADDGVGFEPENRSVDTVKSRGFGLFGIRDRFQMLGGSVLVDSQPGAGTRVTLRAPVIGENLFRGSHINEQPST